MNQFDSREELTARVHALEDEVGDLKSNAHAVVLAQAFRRDGLERALNLSISLELGQMLPELLDLHAYIQAQASANGSVSLGTPKSLGRAYGNSEFRVFAVSIPDVTYMVALEPLPPLVRLAYPDVQQWAIHLRMCTKSLVNPAPASTSLGALAFLSDFRSEADRPSPKRQRYFREWDCTDRGFLASTEPSTSAEEWTPSQATQGVGLPALYAVLKDLWAHCDFVRSAASECPADPEPEQLSLVESALA